MRARPLWVLALACLLGAPWTAAAPAVSAALPTHDGEAATIGEVGGSGLLWENTSVLTLDRTMANNTGENFTMGLDPGAMHSEQNLTVTLSEPLTAGALASTGFSAIDDNGPTLALPFALLPNGTRVTGTSAVPLPGPFTIGIAATRGAWWSFLLDGRPWTGPAPWENGTYDLGTPFAAAFEGAGAARSTAPALTFEEGGPKMPLALLFSVPHVLEFANGSRSLQPANGRLIAATPDSYSVAFTGHNQSAAAPYDALASPGSEPTTQNGTTLWGNLTSSLFSSGIVGAYTNDSRFADNVTTGVFLSYETPPPVAGGEVVLGEVSLPITLEETVLLGYASLNYDSVPVSVPELAVTTGLGANTTVYIDISQWDGPGESENLSLEEWHGPWWNATVNGEPFVATGGIGGSAATNGTLDLGVDRALGVNDRPFHGNTSFTSQPAFFFQGNLPTVEIPASFELAANGGGWETPTWALAWTQGSTQDVAEGIEQNVTVPTGQLVIVNATSQTPAPLANGTVLWTPSWSVAALAEYPAFPSEGFRPLLVWVNESMGPVDDATVTGVVNGSLGSLGPVVWSSALDAYSSAYLPPSGGSEPTVGLVFTATAPGLATPVRGYLTIRLLTAEPLSVSARQLGVGDGEIPAGSSVWLVLLVNGTPGAPAPVAAFELQANVSGGSFGPVEQMASGGGTYEVEYTAPDLGGVVMLELGASAPGYPGTGWAYLNLTLVLPPLQTSAVTCSGTGTFEEGAQATMSVFVNVSSNGTPVAGASVQFSFAPDLPGGPVTLVLTGLNGEAELTLPVPTGPPGYSTGYEVSATVSSLHRASVEAEALTIAVAPAPAPASPASAGSTSLAVLDVVLSGLLALVLAVYLWPGGRRDRREPEPSEGGPAARALARPPVSSKAVPPAKEPSPTSEPDE